MNSPDILWDYCHPLSDRQNSQHHMLNSPACPNADGYWVEALDQGKTTTPALATVVDILGQSQFSALVIEKKLENTQPTLLILEGQLAGTICLNLHADLHRRIAKENGWPTSPEFDAIALRPLLTHPLESQITIRDAAMAVYARWDLDQVKTIAKNPDWLLPIINHLMTKNDFTFTTQSQNAWLTNSQNFLQLLDIVVQRYSLEERYSLKI